MRTVDRTKPGTPCSECGVPTDRAGLLCSKCLAAVHARTKAPDPGGGWNKRNDLDLLRRDRIYHEGGDPWAISQEEN